MQPGRNRHANHSSVHLLSSSKVISDLVVNARLGPDDLVMDLGAGTGAITAELTTTGARVLAVERDEEFVGDLERRYGDRENLRVVHADLLTVPLPRRQFQVVANIPFSITTPLLRRLLNTPNGSLTQADLLVEFGLAKRLTAAWPRDLEAAWWAARFEITVEHRVPATAFRPAPKIDAAHLSLVRKKQSRHLQGVIWALLSNAYGSPNTAARAAMTGFVTRGRAHRLLQDRGIDSQAAVGTIKLKQWLEIAEELAADKSLSWPPLPKNLRTDGTRRDDAPHKGGLRTPQGRPSAQSRDGRQGSGKARGGSSRGGQQGSGQARDGQSWGEQPRGGSGRGGSARGGSSWGEQSRDGQSRSEQPRGGSGRGGQARGGQRSGQKNSGQQPGQNPSGGKPRRAPKR
ncbi:16S rRNA A1518/A1519 N6-dimethyltransferase RsmA/KsgA/DIM1 with predicted DNA glycosylase/AP lyase activity [Crossiella equi]|uniref:16S rRNA A1518/A1519 N6-dimethyltransferase RsmA/KsgA/DIM1 with predicted DNA glycosylase/AP lyase activity n=1 Tax=Crossiella equi TaxID=130796 RepID=A0ABS5AN06_9PSEU|nr:16S rRNA A1518/A1519 N6-dimethyltransferase RsmA/KsgA/DIM1 with predicted DNA glycosylase/AP lyase activity [Crossiella equi]